MSRSLLSVSLLSVLIGTVAVSACIPTSARKNAKLEPGVDLELNAGGQYLLAGEDENGERTDVQGAPHVEVDLQVATEADAGPAFALQVKVPYNFLYTTLDGYVQFPSPDGQTYYGLGAELSISPAIYGIVTRYVSPNTYVSLTPRFLLLADGEDSNAEFAVNPQLSFGVEGSFDLSVFLSYMLALGDGYDIDIDLDFGGSSEDTDFDRRNQFLLAGVAIRL